MRFSVIIPVYNAEKTLRRCVDSVLSQLGDRDELILVNDGSRDSSGAICAEYAGRDARVRLIDKENGGVSSARNAGLDTAQGKYVIFVDSDDYVSPTLYQDIDAVLQEDDWDLIRFSYCVDDGSSLTKKVMQPAAFRTRQQALPKIIDDICSKALNGPVAKVYNREILDREQIRFPLGASVAEDRAFNIHYSLFVERYLISDCIAYFVNTENENSLSRKHHEDLSKQFQIADNYNEEALQKAKIPDKEKETYRRAINFGRCRGIYKYAKDLRRDQIGWLQRQRALWKRCGEINRRKMRYPGTRYCRLITLPVRLRQTWAIDLAAKRLLPGGKS